MGSKYKYSYIGKICLLWYVFSTPILEESNWQNESVEGCSEKASIPKFS